MSHLWPVQASCCCYLCVVCSARNLFKYTRFRSITLLTTTTTSVQQSLLILLDQVTGLLCSAKGTLPSRSSVAQRPGTLSIFFFSFSRNSSPRPLSFSCSFYFCALCRVAITMFVTYCTTGGKRGLSGGEITPPRYLCAAVLSQLCNDNTSTRGWAQQTEQTRCNWTCFCPEMRSSKPGLFLSVIPKRTQQLRNCSSSTGNNRKNKHLDHDDPIETLLRIRQAINRKLQILKKNHDGEQNTCVWLGSQRNTCRGAS